MLPSVWPGDLLTVRRQSFSEFRCGQIVLYESMAGGQAQLVAHRIVDFSDFSGGRSGRQLITRGDSMLRNDAPVHADQILGRVVSISRKGRPIGPDFTRSRSIAAVESRRRFTFRFRQSGPAFFPDARVWELIQLKNACIDRITDIAARMFGGQTMILWPHVKRLFSVCSCRAPFRPRPR